MISYFVRTRKLVLAITLNIGMHAPLSAAEYYVDFDSGSDDNSGLLTSEAWKHAPGDQNASGTAAKTLLTSGDIVIFKGGTVYNGEIRINSNATEGNPIQYRGDLWGEDRAILDGSEAVDVIWNSCNSPSDCGGNPNWENIYWTNIDPNFDPFSQYFIDDSLLFFAQSPNPTDPFFYDEVDDMRVLPFQTEGYSLTDTSITDITNLTQDDPHHFDGAYVSIWVEPNIVQICKINEFNPTNNTITFEGAEGVIPYSDRASRYALINEVGSIDKPGEYALYQNEGRFYLWPPEGSNTSNSSIRRTIHKRAFSSTGCSNILVQGFTIRNYYGKLNSYGDGSAFNLAGYSGISDFTIKGNEIYQVRSMDGYGTIHASANINRLTVSENDIHDCLKSSGMRIGGKNILVSDNIVKKVGRTGIYFQTVTNGVIKNNEVSGVNGTHGNGISAYLNSENIRIDGNIIYDSRSLMTITGSKNYVIVNNMLDAGNQDMRFSDWGGMSGSVIIANNAFIRNSANSMVNLQKGFDGYYFYNNIVDGAPDLKNRSNNIYTGLRWDQKERYGWKLLDSEILVPNSDELIQVVKEGVYTLIPNDKLIDKGTTTPEIAAILTDLNGKQRHQGANIDIGPFEGIPSELISPTNLETIVKRPTFKQTKTSNTLTTQDH